jgi:hypothetical protein
MILHVGTAWERRCHHDPAPPGPAVTGRTGLSSTNSPPRHHPTPADTRGVVLLISGFGVRVPDGAPLLTCSFVASGPDQMDEIPLTPRNGNRWGTAGTLARRISGRSSGATSTSSLQRQDLSWRSRRPQRRPCVVAARRERALVHGTVHAEAVSVDLSAQVIVVPGSC